MSERILKALYGSDKTPLIFGSLKIPCYVLEDGTRVLSRSGIQRALGYDGQSGQMLTRFVSEKNGFPLEIVAGVSHTIKFERLDAGGSQPISNGHEATFLIDLCSAIIDLHRAGVLPQQYSVYATFADIIIRSVAKVGIIALIDEATGYQYEREHDELQTILKAFVSPEILEWQKTFGDTFYKEIFRLKNIPFTAQGIKKRPGFVGKITVTYIYNMLPKGTVVLKHLRNQTPKSESGNYLVRLHQSLTPDIGREALKTQIVAVTTLMSVSNSWAEFQRLFQRKYGQLEISFEENDFAPTSKPSQPKTEFDKQLKGLLSVPPPKKGK